MTVGQIRRAIKYDLARGHHLTYILKTLRMPKSTYYFWRRHKPTKHYKHDVHYRRLITTIWYENRKVYGFMRIRAYLRRYKKIRIGTNRAWRLAHELGLRSIMNKKYVKPHMTDELVTEVMKMALKTTSSDQHPVIMHTDMGSQYTSDEFENYLINCHIRHSYSRKGYSYDNTYIENFHSSLKKEWTFHHQYHNIYEARASIGYYIKWYNTDRISLVS